MNVRTSSRRPQNKYLAKKYVASLTQSIQKYQITYLRKKYPNLNSMEKTEKVNEDDTATLPFATEDPSECFDF
jgi:hypothetical protein